MAVKYLQIPGNLYDDEHRTQFKILCREIENLFTLRDCPNIVTLFGVCVVDSQALLCMELMDTSLRQLYLIIHQEKESYDRFPEELVCYVFLKITDALLFCKNNEIIHRDIKPNNILVNYTGEIKLCDFGESRTLENSIAITHVGTIAYWQPEHFTGSSEYDTRVDTWSLGITLMEIILGRLPYFESNESLWDIKQNGSHTILISQLIMNTCLESIIKNKIQAIGYSKDLCELLNECVSKFDYRLKLNQLEETQIYESYKDVKNETVANVIEEFIQIKKKTFKRRCLENSNTGRTQ